MKFPISDNIELYFMSLNVQLIKIDCVQKGNFTNYHRRQVVSSILMDRFSSRRSVDLFFLFFTNDYIAFYCMDFRMN